MFEPDTATTCSVCFEQKADICSLSECGHNCCRDCLVKWIGTSEAAGRTSAICPFCQRELTQEETCAILGRSFQPIIAHASAINKGEVDDLTRQWLQEHTVHCPGCGVNVQKEAQTCDLMECLCGFRWCYSCSSQGATCSCTPRNHVFWDNSLGARADRSSEAVVAPMDRATGHRNLHRHIGTRTKHQVRARRRQEEQFEIGYMDHITYSARWLFSCQSNKASVTMLAVDSDRLLCPWCSRWCYQGVCDLCRCQDCGVPCPLEEWGGSCHECYKCYRCVDCGRSPSIRYGEIQEKCHQCKCDDEAERRALQELASRPHNIKRSYRGKEKNLWKGNSKTLKQNTKGQKLTKAQRKNRRSTTSRQSKKGHHQAIISEGCQGSSSKGAN